jgi:hypothetical protein
MLLEPMGRLPDAADELVLLQMVTLGPFHSIPPKASVAPGSDAVNSRIRMLASLFHQCAGAPPPALLAPGLASLALRSG